MVTACNGWPQTTTSCRHVEKTMMMMRGIFTFIFHAVGEGEEFKSSTQDWDQTMSCSKNNIINPQDGCVPLTVSHHIVVWNDVKHTEQVNSLSPQSHKWNCRCPFQHLTKIKIGTYLKIDTLWGYLSSPLSCWILLSMALICHSKTCPMYLYIGQRIVELALLGLPWFYRLMITGLGSACWWWSLGYYKIYNCRI